MSERHDDSRRAELKDGGGSRRDYGPAGCAGIVYGTAAVAAALVALLRAGRR